MLPYPAFMNPDRWQAGMIKETEWGVSSWSLAAVRRSAFATLRRDKDFAQGQMCGKKGAEPQGDEPQDDIKVLVDPGLGLLVVEPVNIIQVEGQVWGWPDQHRRGDKKIAEKPTTARPSRRTGPAFHSQGGPAARGAAMAASREKAKGRG